MYNISINRQTVLSKTSNFMLAFCDMGVYRPSLEFCIHFQLRDLVPRQALSLKSYRLKTKLHYYEKACARLQQRRAKNRRVVESLQPAA